MIWWNGMVKGTWMAWCSGEVRDWKASCVCSCSVH
jgi:predicted DNA-binding transcriptional regulator AlpA